MLAQRLKLRFQPTLDSRVFVRKLRELHVAVRTHLAQLPVARRLRRRRLPLQTLYLNLLLP